MATNNTLNKDINLVERENGYWDLEFQYGDYVTSENNQSLRNGLIIACLTSWNYLNRQGNPTYADFGNKAYWELKKKKSKMVEYTIKQYFTEVLNRIRRVHRIVSLEVVNTPTDPNAYNVVFTVEAINDEIVRGNFQINSEKNLSPTILTVTQNSISSSPTKPALFTVHIDTEYEEHLTDELIYSYFVDENNNEELIKVYRVNEEIPIYPCNEFGYKQVKFRFKGNDLFGSSESETFEILSIPFFFSLDEDDNLKVVKNKDYDISVWIGEIVEDYTQMTYDGNPNKHYLIPTNNNEDYNKYTYYNNQWNTNHENIYEIINKGIYGEPTIGDLRLFVEDLNNKLHVIGKLKRENDKYIVIEL